MSFDVVLKDDYDSNGPNTVWENIDDVFSDVEAAEEFIAHFYDKNGTFGLSYSADGVIVFVYDYLEEETTVVEVFPKPQPSYSGTEVKEPDFIYHNIDTELPKPYGI